MRIRYKAVLVAGLAQIALFAIFVLPSHGRWRGAAAPEPVTMILTFFEPEEQQPVPPVPSAPRPVQHQSAPAPLSRDNPPEESEGAITAPLEDAPIDWAEQASQASKATLDQQDKERARRSFDFPKKTDPPPLRRDPAYGDIEHFEGGETIMWVSSRCYYASREIADFAAHMGPGPPPLQRKICKR